MCNLYTVRKSRDEVAGYFRARKPAVEPNLPDDILPGAPAWRSARPTAGACCSRRCGASPCALRA